MLWLRSVGVRNLLPDRFEPGPGINIVSGANGQGKTSLLEAIYLVATTRSFRTSRVREVVSHGVKELAIKVELEEELLERAARRVQTLTFSDRKVDVRVDEHRPASLGEYAVRAPVVVFHPEELALSTGPAVVRRKLLDRLAFYRVTSHLRQLGDYARALKTRQELLRRGAGEGELVVYEQILASTGAAVTRARATAAEDLADKTRTAFERIAAPGLTIELRYDPGGSAEEGAARAELAERRDSDRRSPTAGFGPHRDDLKILIGGHAARRVASQGQHRAITLAIKAAESDAVAEITGLWPIQLLDDISSELDEARTEALLGFLAETRGQVFLTTTRRGLLSDALHGKNTSYFQVVEGAVKSA